MWTETGYVSTSCERRLILRKVRKAVLKIALGLGPIVAVAAAVVVAVIKEDGEERDKRRRETVKGDHFKCHSKRESRI